MVVSGFSLLEVRKLYIDELYEYYSEMFYALEKTGAINEGTYAKITKKRGGSEVETDTVSKLRKQMMRSIADKNKKGK